MKNLHNIFFLLLFFFFDSNGIFRTTETIKVPIERLTKNFEREVIDNPYDYKPLLSLARLYAMSYSLLTNDIEVRKKDSTLWFGDSPDNVPHNNVVLEFEDEEDVKIADKNIEIAIGYYENALALAPSNLIVQLGYGWCLREVGRFEEARVVLRKVVEISYEKELQEENLYEKEMKKEYFNQSSLTEEAHRYLLSILDTVEHKDERMMLSERLKFIHTNIIEWMTPIVIPLKGNLSTNDIINEEQTVQFNLDGSGIKQNWNWITPNVGWLVYDFENKGQILSGRDLIGNVTFWLFWKNGFDVLKAMDDNRDGILKENELKGLSIWNDKNSNGISDSNEVFPLNYWKINELSYSNSEIIVNGTKMWSCINGVHFDDGSYRNTYDIVLTRKEVADLAFSNTK